MLRNEYTDFADAGELLATPMSKQFTLGQLLVIVTCAAMLQGMAKTSPLAAVLISPGAMGSLVGYWRIGSLRGVLFAALHGYYWSLVFACLFGPIVLMPLALWMGGGEAFLSSTWVQGLVVLTVTGTGIVGGYLGAAIELERLLHEQRARDVTGGSDTDA